MDRRASLATLFGKKNTGTQKNKRDKSALGIFSPPVVQSGLEAYNGPWEFAQAAHLLRRATFGPKYREIKDAVGLGYQASLDKIFAVSYPTEGPINPGFVPNRNGNVPITDPNIPTGSPWVYKENGEWKMGEFDPSDQANFLLLSQYRRLSLRAWKMERILNDTTILEKMTLFWHNHFVTADINDPGFEFRYITTLQENALGNFKDLATKITLDISMMIYLNGNENSNRAPNENYARELFELFTIGKGPLAGPGDYTYYTEQDVQEAAKVLTGWRIVRFPRSNNGIVTLENSAMTTFRPGLHDTSDKTFSQRFNGTVISNNDENEYKDLIDMIFNQVQCARFLARKLYRWFVYYEIDDTIEQNVIEPLAQILIDNNYEVEPALRTLLGSQHFFDHINTGPMIKNPIDFVASTLRPFDYEQKAPQDLTQKQIYFLNAASYFDDMQMVYFSPPDVAGWKAYYQEPSFYRIWINSSTLVARSKFTNQVVMAVNDRGRPSPYALDILEFVAGLDNPMDVNLMLDEFVQILYPRNISQEQKDYLKGVLLPGLPDYEWPLEYGDYLNNPDDPDLRDGVLTKLRALLDVMLGLPEFYLS